MTFDELKSFVNDAKERTLNLKRHLKIDDKAQAKKDIEEKMLAPNFWDSREKAQACMNELSAAKTVLESYDKLARDLEDFTAMAELVIENPTEDMLQEAELLWKGFSPTIDRAELLSFLSGKYDKNNAYISIHAGAGGTESCDWASMLFRMYRRWFERRGWSEEIVEFQPGEEAGTKSITVLVKGLFAYGYSKAERGIHRLVRISPFDSNARRHTSFVSVEVMPEFEEDNDEIEIDEKDLRVDTYRSSGAGGQHVNKTDSAIRLTHLPTGIVVACQIERSQHKNRATAMKMLRAKLFALKEDGKKKEANSISGDKTEMGWGNQIRSYVLHPYQMVKDLRTGVETGNTGAVLDGDLDQFVDAWVKNKHKSK